MSPVVRGTRRFRLERLESRETPAALSGSAFVDTNGNGIRDAGEAALPGATVSIDLGSDGTIDGTTATGADGRFGFDGVSDGRHTVSASAAGYTPTTSNPATVFVSGGAEVNPVVDP